MLTIRLKPTGRTGRVSYRIVVDEKRSKLKGRVVDDLGYYNPSENPQKLQVDSESLSRWVGQGAQISKGVSKLLASPATAALR